MDDSQLREIGKSHGIKKFETSDKENLIYDILEQQARDVAATSTANISKGRRPKKEVKDDKSQATTKQKKNNADDNQQPQEAAVETNVTAAQPAKRRGRKPKADSPQAETAELEQQADDNQPAEAQQPDGEQQPKKRRGRPPRNPRPQEADNLGEQQPAETTIQAENTQAETISKEEPRLLPAPQQSSMDLQPVQNGNEAFPDNNRDAVANSEQPHDERPRHGVFIRPGQSPDMLSQNADSTPAQETQLPGKDRLRRRR